MSSEQDPTNDMLDDMINDDIMKLIDGSSSQRQTQINSNMASKVNEFVFDQ